MATENPHTNTTQRYATILISKLSTFFRLPKGRLREESDAIGIPNVVSGESLREVDCDYSFYCTHIDKLVLDSFLVYKKFLKSHVYQEFVNGQAMCGDFVRNYALYLHFNNIDWVVYESDSYNGIGGIFLKEFPWSKTGYVIEPLKHFLANNWQGEEGE